jgi:DNA polymerase V
MQPRCIERTKQQINDLLSNENSSIHREVSDWRKQFTNEKQMEESLMGQVMMLKKKQVVQGIVDGYLNADLNHRFIANPAATYLPLAPNDGIEGIFAGDVLIVDRSIRPKQGCVILAEIDGEYCLRRLIKNGEAMALVDDKGYVPPRLVTEDDYYHGTVTYNIHAQR